MMVGVRQIVQEERRPRIALEPQGDVYLVGSTSSADLPVTPRLVQRGPRGNADGCIVKLVPPAR